MAQPSGSKGRLHVPDLLSMPKKSSSPPPSCPDLLNNPSKAHIHLVHINLPTDIERLQHDGCLWNGPGSIDVCGSIKKRPHSDNPQWEYNIAIHLGIHIDLHEWMCPDCNFFFKRQRTPRDKPCTAIRCMSQAMVNPGSLITKRYTITD